MTIQTNIQYAVFSFFLLASFGAISASPDFMVEMKIIDSGTEIATPQMLVKEGAAASVTLSGKGGVAVGLIVTSSGANEAHITAEVESDGHSMSPELLVRKGEWASVSVGELEFHLLVEKHAASK